MSRVGRLPVKIPDGVQVTVGGDKVDVKGPKGEAAIAVPQRIQVEENSGEVVVSRDTDDRRVRSLHGLVRKQIWNAVTGVSEGFTRVLEINGVGYRAELKGKDVINFSLGYSHPILFQLPEGVTASIDKQTVVTLTGSASTCGNVIGPSIQADVVDYDEYMTGERKEGSYFSVFTFLMKSSSGVMIFITGIALELVGYEPNVEQSETVKFTMSALMSWVSSACFIGAIWIFARFELTEDEHARIRAELDARKAGAAR